MHTKTWLALAAAASVALSGGCKKKDKTLADKPGKAAPTEAAGVPTAATELGAVLGRLIAAANAPDTTGLRAFVDAEAAIRVENALTHARTKPVDRVPLNDKGAAAVKDPAALSLKTEEIRAKLARSIPKKDCAYNGEVARRTPKWPTKKRQGWDFVNETGRIVEHLYDAYVTCKSGYNLEVRFARRAGQADWKVVNVTELPFGVTRPADPPPVEWE